MKTIYLLDKGDTLQKVEKQCNLSTLKLSSDTLFDRNYVCLNDGNDEFINVINYRPIIEYQIKKGESILDILARGFEIDGNMNADSGDTLILTRPSSIRYIVKPTDTIELIGKKYGVNCNDIITSNGLKTSKLFVGQVLWI